ncbi:hypothetical protein K491DRAFT_684862 [Lophiostoma macrostomum CBS 122681]|uniref:Uncharacterized protein n=1 Tax=Lophiostoma macrostomum CBS 122681 TaxID=1314788 RepID=A0A6A6SKG5_9PLEO|nr:hypothetical protein K491DRAFT_684862 [Lophiostoma macrostomum CBS 122681]
MIPFSNKTRRTMKLSRAEKILFRLDGKFDGTANARAFKQHLQAWLEAYIQRMKRPEDYEYAVFKKYSDDMWASYLEFKKAHRLSVGFKISMKRCLKVIHDDIKLHRDRVEWEKLVRRRLARERLEREISEAEEGFKEERQTNVYRTGNL